MAGGADNSNTPTTDLRSNGETLHFFSVRAMRIGTNASDAPVFMHGACNDPSSIFRSDEFHMAGNLNKKNTALTTTLPHIVEIPLFR